MCTVLENTLDGNGGIIHQTDATYDSAQSLTLTYPKRTTIRLKYGPYDSRTALCKAEHIFQINDSYQTVFGMVFVCDTYVCMFVCLCV